jgi:hypothetical protein
MYILPAWRKVWREAVAPLLSDNALSGLRDALARDDACLIQGATTRPTHLDHRKDWPCTGACALAYCGMVEGLETVGEVEQFFAIMCNEVDNRLGERSGVRWFLNAYDEMPRPEMRRLLLAEVDRALAGREIGAEAA